MARQIFYIQAYNGTDGLRHDWRIGANTVAGAYKKAAMRIAEHFPDCHFSSLRVERVVPYSVKAREAEIAKQKRRKKRKAEKQIEYLKGIRYDKHDGTQQNAWDAKSEKEKKEFWQKYGFED